MWLRSRFRSAFPLAQASLHSQARTPLVHQYPCGLEKHRKDLLILASGSGCNCHRIMGHIQESNPELLSMSYQAEAQRPQSLFDVVSCQGRTTLTSLDVVSPRGRTTSTSLRIVSSRGGASSPLRARRPLAWTKRSAPVPYRSCPFHLRFLHARPTIHRQSNPNSSPCRLVLRQSQWLPVIYSSVFGLSHRQKCKYMALSIKYPMKP